MQKFNYRIHRCIIRQLVVFLSASILTAEAVAQNTADSSLVNRTRLKNVILLESVTATASLGGLYFLWYAGYPHSSFHFINDNKEWLQMDKAGHATAAYNIDMAAFNLLRWSGVDEKKAVWYGTATGFTYQALIEIMDGFSAEWGASPGDIAANALGSGMFMVQQLAWKEQRVFLKWSFHMSVYAQYRPEILGRNFTERMLKDYNGQTFWLSTNINSFLPVDSKFPKWLNLALGYSADGMLGAYSNPVENNGVPLPDFQRNRQYFLSLDLDLTRVKLRSKGLRTIAKVIGIIKFPFPAVEYNSGGKWVLHGVYF